MQTLPQVSPQPRLVVSSTKSISSSPTRRIVAAVVVSVLAHQPVRAKEPLEPPVCVARGEQVTLWQWGSPELDTQWNYVIAHGMGGTQEGDRFHLLANAIRRECPDCCVTLLDWSSSATQTRHGVLWPWDVAKQIDPVAKEVATHFASLKFAPERTTFIGESFGCFVASCVSNVIPSVARILAFNPANELGGYTLPDLRKSARETWSFHTFSVYDTTLPLAHADVLLETPPAANAFAQHTFGMTWLTETLTHGDRTWLEMSRALPAREDKQFQIQATLAGETREVSVSRDRELHQPSNHSGVTP